MAKYNHRNIDHRVWLAQNILSVLTKWGFEIDTDTPTWAQEFVVSRRDKYDMTKKIVIYTSIDKRTGAIRSKGSDAIRVVVLREVDDKGSVGLFKQRVYRTGEFKNIITRMLDAVKKAQKMR